MSNPSSGDPRVKHEDDDEFAVRANAGQPSLVEIQRLEPTQATKFLTPVRLRGNDRSARVPTFHPRAEARLQFRDMEVNCSGFEGAGKGFGGRGIRYEIVDIAQGANGIEQAGVKF